MKSIKHILCCCAVLSLLVVGCNKAGSPESATAADVAQATEAAYPVDGVEFQRNGYMADADAKLLIENAKRSITDLYMESS